MINRTFCLPPLMFVGGETEQLKFYLTTASGSVFDADGCTASFALIQYSNHGGTAIITKQAEISADSSGTMCYANVILDAADTAQLCGRYIYQLTVKDTKGNIEIPGQGVFDIIHNIHPSFIY